MKTSHWQVALALLALALLALVPAAGLALGAVAQPNTMGFFLTSSGPGQGADLGGLAGADARCQSLARAAEAAGAAQAAGRVGGPCGPISAPAAPPV